MLPQQSPDIKVFRRRWLVLFLLVVIFVIITFVVSFALINNILVVYFNQNYVVIDWMMVGVNVGTIVASPVIAFLAFSNKFSCKKLLVFAVVLFSLNCALIILGFNQTKLFGLLVFGQFLGGVAAASFWSLPNPLAQLWFPESEIGIVLGISMMGVSGGIILGSLLPTNLLLSPTNQHNSSLQSSLTFNATGSVDWIKFDKEFYEIVYATFLIITLTILILLATCIPEMPKLPPSYAQKFIRDHERVQSCNEVLPFRQFFLATAKLFSDATFIALSGAYSIIQNFIAFYDLIIEELIVKWSFTYMPISHEVFVGYMLTSAAFGCLIGNFSAGYLIDKYKNYHLQSSVGTGLTFCTSIGILLCVYFENIIGCFIVYFWCGLFSRWSFVSLIDSLMQNTYPENPIFATSWVVCIQNVIGVLYVEIGRQIFKRCGHVAALSYVSFLLLVSFVLSVIFKAKKSRTKIEEQHCLVAATSETTCLLEDRVSND